MDDSETKARSPYEPPVEPIPKVSTEVTEQGAPLRSRRGLFVGAGAGVVLVAVIGATAIAMLGGGGDPSPSASPSASSSLAPLPNPTPQGSGFFDDGIADEDLPPMAASRGDGYPEAHQMEEWVWDKVGPNWSLVLFAGSVTSDPVEEARTPVIYLSSSEGTFFELVEIPAAASVAPELVSWHEEDRVASIVWEFGNSGAFLGLTDGFLDELAFTGQSSGDWHPELFLAGNAAGTELWSIPDSNGHSRYYTWSPGGEWQRVLADKRDVASPVGSSTHKGISADPGGTRVLFMKTSGTAEPGRDYMVYDLDTGETTDVIPDYPRGWEWCGVDGWGSRDTLLMVCMADDWGTTQSYLMEVSGGGSMTPVDEDLHANPSLGYGPGDIYVVPGSPVELVMTSGGRASKIQIPQADGGYLLWDASAVLLVGSFDVGDVSVTTISSGVYRISVAGGVLGFDTNVGVITTLFTSSQWERGGLDRDSTIWFGEFTPAGAGMYQE